MGLSKPAAVYLKQLRQEMNEAAQVVDECSSEIQKRYTQRYNHRSMRKDFSVGDQVLVVQSEGGSKLQPKWQGPVAVKERTRADSYAVVDAAGAEDQFMLISSERELTM
ncbi:hypothetical protein HPB50_017620 [Hyalomma asiaticum]|uniref:Uncharacterized protein n=1 Tax=Hyalomma asiaticum TaxID=266040 RepID=A0ACB7RV99_HYAAI|nr:hypothetical protein HPB50_017620 [Hyalomma asiaticum]